MSIFQTTTMTPEAQAATQIMAQSNQAFTSLTGMHTRLYNLVWSNKNATPDKVVTALGVNAVKAFTASAGLAQYLNSLGASPALPTSIPTGWTFTANQDGSATLTKVS